MVETGCEYYRPLDASVHRLLRSPNGVCIRDVPNQSWHRYYGRYDLDLEIVLGINTNQASKYIPYYLDSERQRRERGPRIAGVPGQAPCRGIG